MRTCGGGGGPPTGKATGWPVRAAAAALGGARLVAACGLTRRKPGGGCEKSTEPKCGGGGPRTCDTAPTRPIDESVSFGFEEDKKNSIKRSHPIQFGYLELCKTLVISTNKFLNKLVVNSVILIEPTNQLRSISVRRQKKTGICF